MSTLVIIESPGKKAKLEAFLGAGYTVRASFGHVRDLPEHGMGVAAPDYRPEYVTENERAKATLAGLRKAARESDAVLLATDPDREGEAIAWHLAEALGLRSVQRITYSEITKKAVTTAVANPRPINMNLVHAQEARRVVDRLVGYEVTPAVSNTSGQSLTAGRVQSPAVRLVVERERAIRGFVATKHYGAKLHFGDWSAVWCPVLAEGEYQLDKALADIAAGVRNLVVIGFEDTETKAAPPAPFTTSTLQQRAETALKFKPSKTMEVAQRLYELGAITYMRTDSPNLSDEAYADIVAYAQANALPLAAERRTWSAKGDAQEAHEAIRPTHVDDATAGETEDERALYQLIRARTIASQLAPATYAVRTAHLESVDVVLGSRRSGMTIDAPAAPLSFVARGRTLVDAGWQRIYADEDTDAEDDDDTAANPVPALAVNDHVTAVRGETLAKTTKAPRRYTLATLVKALEAHGIGRPATYASILDNITKRAYIESTAKGQLAATALGETLVDALVGTFSFADLDYTRTIEESLDLVARGSTTYRSVVAQLHEQIAGEISRLGPRAAGHPCPECGKPLRRRPGKRGPFWGCTGYPSCTATLPDFNGAPGARSASAAATPAAAGAPAHSCPDCGKPLRRNTKTAAEAPNGRAYDFWGCTGYRDGCKRTFKPGPDGAPVIPVAP